MAAEQGVVERLRANVDNYRCFEVVQASDGPVGRYRSAPEVAAMLAVVEAAQGYVARLGPGDWKALLDALEALHTQASDEGSHATRS